MLESLEDLIPLLDKLRDAIKARDDMHGTDVKDGSLRITLELSARDAAALDAAFAAGKLKDLVTDVLTNSYFEFEITFEDCASDLADESVTGSGQSAASRPKQRDVNTNMGGTNDETIQSENQDLPRDEWTRFIAGHRVGDIVSGTVTGVVRRIRSLKIVGIIIDIVGGSGVLLRGRALLPLTEVEESLLKEDAIGRPINATIKDIYLDQEYITLTDPKPSSSIMRGVTAE